MLDEALLDKELKRLNQKWFQADRKYRWMLTEENNVPYIKRNIRVAATGKKTFQRLPRKIYRDLSKSEMENLITRLNFYEDRDKRMRERFQIESAFIPKQYLKDFYDQLENEIPTPEVVTANWSNLKKHFLDYFIKLSPNPADWHRNHQVSWAKYLFQTNLSPRGLRSIIQISNRFMRFLNKRRPDEIPHMEFKPISKARFRKYSNEWQESGRGKQRRYISELDYHKILKNIPTEIRSIFILCYKFGLRRGEAMGLHEKLDHVRKDYLYINKQLKRYTREHEAVLGATKGRKSRKVPYWNSNPGETYELIKNLEIMCPDECTRKFSDYCKSLKLNYTLHDCRHTFITNAVNNRDYQLNDVRLAVGHTDLRVTSGYLKDSRDYDDQIWTPDSEAEAG